MRFNSVSTTPIQRDITLSPWDNVNYRKQITDDQVGIVRNVEGVRPQNVSPGPLTIHITIDDAVISDAEIRPL